MNFKVMPIARPVAVGNAHSRPQTFVLRRHQRLTHLGRYFECRSCLKVFRQGEDERIYLTYNSFEGRSTLPDPGPIFIHKDDCEEHSGGEFPRDLLDLPLLLESFGDESRLLQRQNMNPASVSDQISSIFSDEQVRFINLRNAEAGCFIARIDRK